MLWNWKEEQTHSSLNLSPFGRNFNCTCSRVRSNSASVVDVSDVGEQEDGGDCGKVHVDGWKMKLRKPIFILMIFMTLKE